MSANAKKESFLLSLEDKPLLDELTNEEAGILIKAIYEYEFTGECSQISDRVVRMVFNQLKDKLDKNREKYVDKCKKRADAAKSRYMQNEQLHANASKCMQKEQVHANATDNDNEYDNEYDNDYDIDNDIIIINDDNNISANDDEDKGDSCVDGPIEFFEKNIILGSAGDYEKKIISNLELKIGKDLLLYAMQKAIDHNAKNIKYIKSIINNWIKQKVTTLEEAEKINNIFELKKGQNQFNSKNDNVNSAELDDLYEN